jgi:hypothetical protein
MTRNPFLREKIKKYKFFIFDLSSNLTFINLLFFFDKMNLLDLDHNSLEIILSYLKYRDGTSLLLTNKNLYSLLIEQLKEKIRIPRVEDDEIITKRDKGESYVTYTITYNKDVGITVFFKDEFIKKEREYIERNKKNDIIIKPRPNPINIIKRKNSLYLDDFGNLYHDLYELTTFRLIKTNVKDFIYAGVDGGYFYILDNYGNIYEGNDKRFHSLMGGFILNSLEFKTKFTDCSLSSIGSKIIINDNKNKQTYIYDKFNEFVDEKFQNIVELIKGENVDNFLYNFRFNYNNIEYKYSKKIDYRNGMYIFIDNRLFVIDEKNIKVFDEMIEDFFFVTKFFMINHSFRVCRLLIYCTNLIFYIYEYETGKIKKIEKIQIINDIKEAYQVDDENMINNDIIQVHLDDYVDNYLLYNQFRKI